MQTPHVTAGGGGKLSLFERILTLFTRVRPGEGRAVGLLFLNFFLVLGCYSLLKPLREALILSESSAEMRSYASAFQAALLLLLIPVYGLVFRQRGDSRIVQRINLFFVLNLLLFAGLGFAGLRFGVLFFVWVGIFNVMVNAQFWAFAADLFNVKAGQRLFAVIAIGGSIGAMAGARASGWLVQPLGPYGVMAVAALVLAATLFVSRRASAAVPLESSSVAVQESFEPAPWLGGFHAVFRNHYLLAIAALVLLMNWIMSNGDYVLSLFVQSRVAEVLGPNASSDAKAIWMNSFFSPFQFWINVSAFVVQLFVVARLFQWAGVHVAILVLPMVMAGGYVAIDLMPLFVLMQFVMGSQRMLDYSLMNTTRNALFLPTTRVEKYEGKTAIDTFFVRFGDMFSALAVFGATSIGIRSEGFISINIVLSLALLALAWYIGRHYRRQAGSEAFNRAPLAHTPIPDAHWCGAGPFMHAIPSDAFIDSDAGDVLRVQLRGLDEPLPGWIRYEERTLTLHCDNPPTGEIEIRVVAVARDYDGLEATSTFIIRRVPG